ncbi:MAG: TlpA family protein disulfide reductase [Myxococcales bacterium]|nr:TlpA family protein disulfide reductase [Myxococcales bacterium]
MNSRWLYLAAVLVSLSFSCDKKTEKKDTSPGATSKDEAFGKAKTSARSQWYRIEVAAEGGNVPFMLEVQLPLEPTSIATVANGTERISREMTCDDLLCMVEFSVFASTLELDFTRELRPEGEWRLSDYYPGNQVAAKGVAVNGPGAEYRYVKSADPAVDIGGKWVLGISGVGPGKAEFVQKADGTVSGWIVPTNIGDVRYLDGRVSGTQAKLSTFDGQHAYNVELKVSEDGQTLEGVWHYHEFWHYTIKGWRGKEPSLDELHTFRLKPGLKTLSLPELEALRGKPVIMDFYGTWCSTCIDLMPVLVDLYARYKGDGLEILSIAFEPSDDKDLVAKQVALFRERYGITWESSTRDVEDLDVIFEELENTEGFPLVFFVDRAGTVRGLHSGFVSGAAAVDHAELLEKFETLTKLIVAPMDAKAP